MERYGKLFYRNRGSLYLHDLRKKPDGLSPNVLRPGDLMPFEGVRGVPGTFHRFLGVSNKFSRNFRGLEDNLVFDRVSGGFEGVSGSSTNVPGI